MSQTTYMFGAGASFGTVPLVAEIPGRLLQFIDQLRLHAKALSDKSTFQYERPENLSLNEKSQRDLQLELIEDLNWLHGSLVAEPDFTIDEIAWRVSRKKKMDINKIKNCLSIFLTVEQIVYRRNSRYDRFFAYLLKTPESTILPPNIKIISWNYDYQFELAFNELTGFNDLRKNQDELGVVAKNSGNRGFKKNGFSIFKVNGTASFLDLDSILERNDLNIFKRQEHTIELIREIVKFYSVIKKNSDKLAPLLSFAWEPDQGGNLIADAIESIKDTETLVVIGYSFPEFNSDIDSSLLNAMPSLETIYIQTLEKAMNETEKRLKSRIKAPTKPKIIQESNLEVFYIP